VPISPSGMSINSDLSFMNNNATILRSSRYFANVSPLALPADIGCVYVAGVDLYFNDVNGNQIRITQTGSVAGSAGTITGLPSGTASAAYNAGSSTFIFQSATVTPANIDGGSYILRNLVANSKGLTLNPPNAMAADYSITLPSLPAVTNFMTMTAGGIIGAAANVDNSTIQFSTNTLSVKDGGITRPKLAAVNQFVSPSASFNSSSTTPSTVVTCPSYTSTGRPIILMFIPDGSGSPPQIFQGNNVNGVVTLNLLRDATIIAQYILQPNTTGQWVLPPSFIFMDAVAAGTYVYSLQASVNAGAQVTIVRCVLTGYEL